MATTVAQHSVATFTSPVNGTTPIDANTVRGNDNTTRAAYNDHDADPGIHVQSSTLASRPVAGTAGRKWITEDSGVYTLWFDDGTNWHPVSSENVALTVLAGENLVKGDVVKVTGWNNGQDLPEVVKTTSAADTAFAVITATVSSGSMGYATNTGIVQDVNTAAYSVGTILYANGSGGFTSTKPTSGNYQPVAYVLRANASNGVYYVEFSTPRIVERSDNTASTVVLRDSNGDFSAGTITATAVNATTLDLTNLEVTNIKAKDGTQAIAIADTTGKLTISDGVLLSGLTASQAVFTDGSKNLVSNAITGTGNVVMSASPTLTGTVTAATLNATTLGGTLSTAAQPNVTSVGTLGSLTVSGAVDGSSTITASNALASAAVMSRDTSSTGSFVRILGDFTSQNLINWQTGTDIRFATSTQAYGTFTEHMRILSNGNLAVDTNTLYVDAANNRVGVGTASPASALEVVGAARLSADASSVSLYTGTGWRHTGSGGLYIDANNGGAAGSVYIRNGSGLASQLELTGSGNLGLGVTPSAWWSGSRVMQIGQGATFEGRTGSNIASVSSNSFINASGVESYINTAAATKYNQGVSGDHRWYTAPSGTAGNAITFSQAMTLDATGNVQIGRTTSSGSPYKLELNSTSDTRFALSVGTTLTGGIDVASNLMTLVAYGASTPMTFQVNSAERARIDASGNVLVGTTTATGSAPSRGLVVINGLTGGSAAANLTVNNTWTGTYYADTGGVTLGAVANLPLLFTTNNTERARITSGGRLLVGTTSENTSGGVLQVSNGITFPATQSASSDANTLDDYEEGTWTPTQGAGITLVGTFSSAGSYTKVGRLVHAYGYVAGSTSVALATAGSVVCAGLPFTAPAAEGQMGVLGNNATTASSAMQLSSATIYNNGTIAATTKIFITVSYYV